MKITPTTNDMLHETKRKRRPPGNGGLHIAKVHEPLRDEPFALVEPVIIPPPIPLPIEAVPQPATEAKLLKIALVGTAPSSRLLAPYGDPAWDIWVCSPGNMTGIPRITRWFEIHASMSWPENQQYGPNYVEWMKKQPFPVYMQSKEWVPNAIVYPKDEMVQKFGGDFFTSSFSWMMALAIHEGASEIALYGIDMASREEYIQQRPGFYFFRREARKLGIKVSAPHESDIMTSPPLYGFSESRPYYRKLLTRELEIKERVGAMRQQLQEKEKLQYNIAYLEGALEDVDYMKSIFGGVQDHTSTGEPNG